MRERIDSAVAEVEAKYRDGALTWNYGTVQSLITPFPRTGHLDTLKPGQEDEATPDPDGVPWEVDGGESEAEEAHPEEEGGPEAELEDCGEVPDFDPEDWADPEVADVRQFAPQEASALQDTMVMAIPGAKGSENASLSPSQAEALIGHSSRLRALERAKGILSDLGGALGASMNDTVNRVVHDEGKRFQVRMRGDAVVEQAMRASLDAEEAKFREARRELQEQMQRVKEKAHVQRELDEAAKDLKRLRKETRQAEAVITAKEHFKAYSLEMLGRGKKKGGGLQHQKARLDVLERLRKAAELSPQQTSHWDYFKTTWDAEMAAAHGEDWAPLFAEMMQKLVEDLLAGKRNAVSALMNQETQRVLASVPALVVPGLS